MMSNYFCAKGNKKVLRILENACKNSTKIRVWYGDKETGRDWGEIYDVFGYVGRSTGTQPIPILLKRRDSIGGGAMLPECIVRITIDKRDVYRHPKFNQPKYSITEASKGLKDRGYNYCVFADGENIYNCKTLKQAENEIAFHLGTRNVA